MSTVILQGYIIVPDSDLDAVVAELPNHTRLTLAEPGCKAFRITRAADNPNRFDVYEEFVDPAAFEAHKQRMRNTTWAAAAKSAARHYEVTGV